MCIIVAVCCANLMKRYHWMSNSQHVRNMSCGLQPEKRCSRRCKWFVKGFKRNAWFPHLLMPINKWSKEVSADSLLTDRPTFLRRDSFHWIVRVSRHSFKTTFPLLGLYLWHLFYVWLFLLKVFKPTLRTPGPEKTKIQQSAVQCES